jgi:hypothetical protein
MLLYGWPHVFTHRIERNIRERGRLVSFALAPTLRPYLLMILILLYVKKIFYFWTLINCSYKFVSPWLRDMVRSAAKDAAFPSGRNMNIASNMVD